jgi:hypothetical protein
VVSFSEGSSLSKGRRTVGCKFGSGKAVCRLNRPVTHADFLSHEIVQRGVGPMVWRRFCFWGLVFGLFKGGDRCG